MVKLFLVFTFFLALVFSVFWSPISMGGILILTSMTLVVLMGLLSSSWYAFVLFLVYVGGLLVLFIYVCMVSSNYSMSFKIQGIVMALLLGSYLSFILEISSSSTSTSYTTGSLLVSDPLVPLFIGLVVFLLFVFLAIVRVITAGAALVIESK